jgi:Bardet-Biedl syndrome 4 protein
MIISFFFFSQGVCFMYLKEYDAARTELLRALNLHKNDQSFVVLGKIHLLQGDVAGAINVYKMAIA